MKARRRDILISCSIILLCLAIVVGVSYALFTDSVSVQNHLQAGTLDVKLYRTNLKYNVLDNEDGYFNEITDNSTVEFTNSTNENIFGINTQNAKIAPGSYFEADLKLENNGDVAFTYGVKIKMLNDTDNEYDLEDQLMVTITQDRNGNGTIEAEEKTYAPLRSFTSDTPYAFGEMAADDNAQSFNVKIEFQNLANDVNNKAQTETAAFDLIVIATQKTNR